MNNLLVSIIFLPKISLNCTLLEYTIVQWYNRYCCENNKDDGEYTEIPFDYHFFEAITPRSYLYSRGRPFKVDLGRSSGGREGGGGVIVVFGPNRFGAPLRFPPFRRKFCPIIWKVSRASGQEEDSFRIYARPGKRKTCVVSGTSAPLTK